MNIILNIFKWLCIFSILMYVFVYIYMSYKHPFWYKQPVSHYTSLFLENGIIKKRLDKPILHNTYKIKIIDINDNNQLDKIKLLLNNNYNISKYYKHHYDISYLKWSINIPLKHYNINYKNKLDIDSWNFGIYENNDITKPLISYISGKPIQIMLDNKHYSCFYVDYLCIDKKYRKQKIAESIISYMAYHGFIDYFKFFIFKKEMYPLPYKYISKYQLYLIDTTKIETLPQKKKQIDIIELDNNKLTNSNIDKLYQFYIKNIDRYKQLKNIYHYQEFKHYLLTNQNQSIYIDNLNNIHFMILLFDSKTTLLNHKTGEFLFLLFDIDYYNNDVINDIIDKVCSLNKAKFKNIIINNQNYILDYVAKNKLEKLTDVYLHLYNFHHNSIIDKKNISFIIP